MGTTAIRKPQSLSSDSSRLPEAPPDGKTAVVSAPNECNTADALIPRPPADSRVELM